MSIGIGLGIGMATANAEEAQNETKTPETNLSPPNQNTAAGHLKSDISSAVHDAMETVSSVMHHGHKGSGPRHSLLPTNEGEGPKGKEQK
jgi:hypothetical protein